MSVLLGVSVVVAVGLLEGRVEDGDAVSVTPAAGKADGDTPSAFRNRACRAWRTPRAALERGFRLAIASKRSTDHWKCWRALCTNSGCSRGKRM